MAYAKNKKVGKNSQAFNIENSLPAVHKTRRARHAREAQDTVNRESSKIVTSIVILTMLVVILSALTAVMSTPEKIIKHKITEIAQDYYENYYYDQMLSHVPASKSLDAIMGPYADAGLSNVSFDQLFSFDNQRHAEAKSAIAKYCDTRQSYVLIYPEPPYSSKDYHINYNYSCKF